MIPPEALFLILEIKLPINVLILFLKKIKNKNMAHIFVSHRFCIIILTYRVTPAHFTAASTLAVVTRPVPPVFMFEGKRPYFNK